MKTIKGKDVFLALSIGIILVLGGIIYYLMPYYNQGEGVVKYEVYQESPKEFKKRELEKEFFQIIETLNLQKQQNQGLSKIIDNQKVQILDLKKEIEEKIEAGINREELQKELGVLRAKSAVNLKIIQDLKNEKYSLEKAIKKAQSNNEALLVSNIKRVKEVDSLQQELKKNMRQYLEEKRKKEAVIGEKIQLEDEIEQAKFVPLSALKVTPMNSRRNKSTISYTAKKVDYLNICFNTSPNIFLKEGRQDFFVNLIDDSKGIPVQLGGDYTQLKDGSEVRFVRILEVEYVKDYSSHCFDLQLQKQLEFGNYTMRLFNNGYLVGETNLILQKGGGFF